MHRIGAQRIDIGAYRARAESLHATALAVVVENRPGASGIIGVNAAAQAAPDGYTLLIGTLSTHALVPHASANVPYDALRDFAPVANLFRSIKVLWVHPDLPVRNIEDWIRHVRARPGALNFASGGIGSSNHVDMELVKSVAGLDMVHVPSSTNAMLDLIAGRVQVFFANIAVALPQARDGKVRALAVTSQGRASAAPELPSVSESGLTGFESISWFGLLAPAGTPPAILQRLEAEALKAVNTPAMKERFTTARQRRRRT